MSINSNLTCGPGLQEQNRTCYDGTGDNRCSLEDMHQKVLCKEVGTELEDCPKELGQWSNVGPCVPIGFNQICGPGTQNQTRTCKDGTGKELCNDEDIGQIVSCAQAGTDLPDCSKRYGQWENVGECQAEDLNEKCGPGIQLQERTCQNGTGQEICTINDTSQLISCKDAGSDLPDCPKVFSPWENIGKCVSKYPDRNCGSGTQKQQRICTNGTGLQTCTDTDRRQEIPCKHAGTELPDCPKTYGVWTNVGSCISSGSDPACGSGQQKQTRSCINGTGSEICSKQDEERITSCLDANNPLPDCPKQFSEWENSGPCVSIFNLLQYGFSCGPGEQTQTRTCTDGSGLLICTAEEKIQRRTVRCLDAGTALPECPGASYVTKSLQWMNENLSMITEFFSNIL